MQQGLPITINADSAFSKALPALANKLEMWLNFQALKANWYGNEETVLTFDFTLVRALEDKKQDMKTDSWVVKSDYAYHYDSHRLNTIALIPVADLLNGEIAIEQAIKKRLTEVTNIIGKQHGFQGL